MVRALSVNVSMADVNDDDVNRLALEADNLEEKVNKESEGGHGLTVQEYLLKDKLGLILCFRLDMIQPQLDAFDTGADTVSKYWTALFSV